MTNARPVAAVALVLVILLSLSGPATAGTQESDAQPKHDGSVDAPAVVVELNGEGDGTLTITSTFDLTDEGREQAFKDLRDSQSAREDFRNRFGSRMRSVADAAENETGREMEIRNATLDFRTVGSVGVVAASVEWRGFAGVDVYQLSMSEPFASGFESDRPVHVLAPEGYHVLSVSPEPDGNTSGHLQWDAGRDLSGFEVVLESDEAPDETDETEEPEEDDDSGSGNDVTVKATSGGGDETEATGDGGSGPGFGFIATLGAIVAIAALVRLRE